MTITQLSRSQIRWLTYPWHDRKIESLRSAEAGANTVTEHAVKGRRDLWNHEQRTAEKSACVFGDSRAWPRVIFLGLRSGGCECEARLCAEMSQASGTPHLRVPREWQQRGLCTAVVSEPLCHSTRWDHTPVEVIHKLNNIYTWQDFLPCWYIMIL